MKVIYIAHPVAGDVAGNLKKIEAIARQINLEEPETVPFAPYFLDCHAMDDSLPDERARGIKNNHALLKKGFINELRLYGDRISPGMQEEVELALELGIPVEPTTSLLWDEYLQLLQNDDCEHEWKNHPIHGHGFEDRYCGRCGKSGIKHELENQKTMEVCVQKSKSSKD